MADVDLFFKNQSSLPNTSSVAQTLVEAASSSNFSLSVNTSSISVQGKFHFIQSEIKITSDFYQLYSA